MARRAGGGSPLGQTAARRVRLQQSLHGLVHHSDRSSRYTAIRYTDRLATAGALASVGSTGDSYNNALSESTIGEIKTELIHRRAPWRTVEQPGFALFEYLDWWNHCLHSEIGLTTQPRKRPPTTVSPGP